MIYIVNASSVSDSDVQKMVDALNVAAFGFNHFWSRHALSAHASFTKKPPTGSPVITVMNDPDQANALGWHSIVNGVPMGRVFVKPVLDNGGTVLQGQLTVASVLDHEYKELRADAMIQLWAFNEADGYLYAYEVCDPVESDIIEVKTPLGVSVSVSNYVTPAWFESESKGPYDALGKLSAPFQLDAGGYLIKSKAGNEVAVYGHKYPDWRRELKVRGRTAHRRGELDRNRVIE